MRGQRIGVLRRMAGLACLGLLLVPCGVCVLGPCALAQETEFVRGDVNQDGRVSIADALFLRRCLFTSGPQPLCRDAADVNDDGKLNIVDEITVLALLLHERHNGELVDVLPEPYPLPGVDPTNDTFTCGSFNIVPAETSDDIIEVGEVAAAAGDEVSIPIFISSSIPVQAFQIVFETDSSRFTPCEGPVVCSEGRLPLDFAGSAIAETMHAYDGPESSPYGCPSFAYVKALPDPGRFVIMVMLTLAAEVSLPPSQNKVLLLSVKGRVAEDVPDGAAVSIYPTNGDQGTGSGPHALMNELCYRGEASYASLLPQRFQGGKITVKSSPDLLDYFMRGDANRDAVLNIADPIFVITYLFAHGSEPACADAADMNDDGTLDVADAIAGLTYLFGNRGSLSGSFAETMGRCGRDVAADTLPLCMYERCAAN